MSYKSLRDFIARLEKTGELVRVTEPVSTVLEMTEIQNKVAGLRRFGAASLDMAFVAAGRLDGYWERNLQAWDMAAGAIMVREAGGIVSGITADEDPLKTGHVICGNEFVHGELVKILKPLGK